MRLICRRFFQRAALPQGIEITEAETGESAIDLLTEREFDCVLTDYRMGAITGIEVLAYAQQKRPEAIRILMTGFGTTDLNVDATLRANAHEVFEKPMTSREIGEVLRERVLERYLKARPASQA